MEMSASYDDVFGDEGSLVGGDALSPTPPLVGGLASSLTPSLKKQTSRAHQLGAAVASSDAAATKADALATAALAAAAFDPPQPLNRLQSADFL
jgi:hypothetical protein